MAMKKLILCKLLIINSLCLEAFTNSQGSPGNKSAETAGNATFNLEINDFFMLLILITLVYGSFQYYRYYKNHLRIDKSIKK